MTYAPAATLAEPVRGHPWPRPGRWGLVWRYALASLPILPVAASALYAGDLAPRLTPLWLLVLDPLLFPVALLLIRGRRRHPLGTALALSVVVAWSSTSVALWAWSVVSMATRRRWGWAAGVGALTLAASSTATYLSRSSMPVSVTSPDGAVVLGPEDPLLLGIVALSILLAYVALVAWGFYVGARRDLLASLTERAETAEREQALRVAQAQAGERARIAREMHDVLAHRISLVGMNAGILAFRDDLAPQQTREIAQVIQENAAASLVELRAVLGTLREPGVHPEKPQPTLADLPALVEEARTAGASVTVVDTLESPADLPPATGRHAYRIVQEGLTNARKHAVSAPVRVTLSGRPGDGLTIEVSNPLTASSGLVGAGLGLVGVAERAQIAGGACTAGAENGSFVRRAWLPWKT